MRLISELRSAVRIACSAYKVACLIYYKLLYLHLWIIRITVQQTKVSFIDNFLSQLVKKSQENKMDGKSQNPQPGDGLRSMKTTMLFRAVNFELYTRPNLVIMGLGIAAMTGAAGYIFYMRSKYEGMGFYTAVESDGKETFKKKVSKWNN